MIRQGDSRSVIGGGSGKNIVKTGRRLQNGEFRM
jgi:hypothetical protein